MDNKLRPSGMTVSVMNNGSPQVEAQTTYAYRTNDSRLATVSGGDSQSPSQFTYTVSVL